MKVSALLDGTLVSHVTHRSSHMHFEIFERPLAEDEVQLLFDDA